ncbi:MAG: outer membrane lipoprotein-sorting protein [Chthonomonadales bacterium]|nr:outer membrane lipoprotein-sorting protein [Chthonomonadales bacterium]
MTNANTSGAHLRWHIMAALTVALIGLAAAPGRSETQEVQDIIRRYVKARHTVNLRGRMLSVQPTANGVRTCSRRIVRRSDGRSLSVFETPAQERGAAIADDGTWLIRYDPRDRVVRKKRSFQGVDARSVERNVRLILRNYAVRREPDETVAGRNCRRLLLEPSRPRNLTVRLWIDAGTGVEMRRDEQDAAGNTISIMMYTSVEFPRTISLSEVTPAIPRGARTVNISRSGLMTTGSEISKTARFPVRFPLALPWGYEFDRGTVVEIAGRRSGFLRYTDGLSEITIIQSRSSPGGDPSMRAARVIPRLYGEVEVDYALDDLQIVVVGRGEARELIAMAETISGARETAWRSAMARTFNSRATAVGPMRDRGLSAEAIVALLTIAERAGPSPTVLLASYQAGWGWRDIARRWRVPEADINRRLQTMVGGK